MASFAYKAVRRAVNFLAFIMFMMVIVTIVYDYKTKIIQAIEISSQMGIQGACTLLNYTKLLTIFIAMFTSTSINSKSKFTLKLAITCTIVYSILIGLILVYLYIGYYDKIAAYLNDVFSPPNNVNNIISMTMKTMGIPPHDLATDPFGSALNLADGEIFVIKAMLMVLLGCSFLSTIFMIYGIHCKISKDKPAVLKEAEVFARSVGLTPAPSTLRNHVDRSRANA
ncbi:hypothetical protein NEDG_00798 [Nematocida displodere]|uniref:Uncharacterized protein n=1 Tax=Nematocida displodere TaxID=1805483 RepID=A0A177ECI9_9MICR|nr:hypothetical protein NEDG_00798 [Nematocida displodere]